MRRGLRRRLFANAPALKTLEEALPVIAVACRRRVLEDLQNTRPRKPNFRKTLVTKIIDEDVRNGIHEERQRDSGESLGDAVREIAEVKPKRSIQIQFTRFEQVARYSPDEVTKPQHDLIRLDDGFLLALDRTNDFVHNNRGWPFGPRHPFRDFRARPVHITQPTKLSLMEIPGQITT